MRGCAIAVAVLLAILFVPSIIFGFLYGVVADDTTGGSDTITTLSLALAAVYAVAAIIYFAVRFAMRHER